MSKLNTQPVKGMKDVLGEDIAKWHCIEKILILVANQFNYQEIRTPVLEKMSLYSRAVGEYSDIVNKELYQFKDLDESILALRPEGTSSVIRALNNSGVIHNKQSKHFYIASMYRRERPQKGRYREFKQFGCEFVGCENIYADVEVLRINIRIFEYLKINQKIKLYLNSIGSSENRKKCSFALHEYFQQYKNQLSEKALQTLQKNTLRLFDSKEDNVKQLLINAPKIEDYIDNKSKDDFVRLRSMLDQLNISYEVDGNLVRGLDYYNDMVFEFKCSELGSQDTVSAGGRYDGLNQILYQNFKPAVGFAMGIDRLMLILEQNKLILTNTTHLIYAFSTQDELLQNFIKIIHNLSLEEFNIRIELDYNSNSFSKAFSKASKLNADTVLIYGEDEAKKEEVAIKNMHSGEQISIKHKELNNYLISNVK